MSANKTMGDIRRIVTKWESGMVTADRAIELIDATIEEAQDA